MIHIGTSGWSYKHWRGTFYPTDLKEKDWFSFYRQYFDSVELNSSFYHLPPEKTFANWRKAVPDHFLFVVKASRYITHMKKLHDTQESVDYFFKNVGALKEKLGPILFQLPPGWQVNAQRLVEFLAYLPRDHRYVFEFRNPTWYAEEVKKTLEHYNVAFCIYELDRHLSPEWVTADFVYLRLHGPEGKYQGSYTKTTLQQWAQQCVKWQEQGKDVYVYFDNDQHGYAAFNALEIKKEVDALLSEVKKRE